MAKKVKKSEQMGFLQAMIYVLDLLCYAYYVKNDNLVSDQTFDELEKLYCKMFGKEHAPSRAMEREECYSTGVKFIYDWFRRNTNKKEKCVITTDNTGWIE